MLSLGLEMKKRNTFENMQEILRQLYVLHGKRQGLVA
jgi:hypothetical protein